jgi:hypothetical protein
LNTCLGAAEELRNDVFNAKEDDNNDDQNMFIAADLFPAELLPSLTIQKYTTGAILQDLYDCLGTSHLPDIKAQANVDLNKSCTRSLLQ